MKTRLKRNFFGAKTPGAELFWREKDRAELFWCEASGDAENGKQRLSGFPEQKEGHRRNFFGVERTGRNFFGVERTGRNFFGVNPPASRRRPELFWCETREAMHRRNRGGTFLV